MRNVKSITFVLAVALFVLASRTARAKRNCASRSAPVIWTRGSGWTSTVAVEVCHRPPTVVLSRAAEAPGWNITGAAVVAP